jgi:hypothetical protein
MKNHRVLITVRVQLRKSNGHACRLNNPNQTFFKLPFPHYLHLEMEATFGEPYLLSSYAQSSKSASLLPHVFGSPCPLKNKSEGYIGVAVQGDGVHVLDVRCIYSFRLDSLIEAFSACYTTYACFALDWPFYDICLPTTIKKNRGGFLRFIFYICSDRGLA